VAGRGSGLIEKKGRSSFLKKRSKKLLIIGACVGEPITDRSQPSEKSFLVLFFKKEHVFSF
jgi:hypothetical protein